MSELEDFKAGSESRQDVVSRARRASGSADEAVARLVEAAVYRETHRAAAQPSTADEPAPDDE